MPEFPAPVPTQDTEPFWRGCQEGKLLLQRCPACGTFRHPPRPMCSVCASMEVEWALASGRGTIYSYTVTHQALHPSLVDKVPHVVILVELEEGVRITSNILNCPPDQLRIGMPVEVTFQHVNEETTLPKFKPVGHASLPSPPGHVGRAGSREACALRGPDGDEPARSAGHVPKGPGERAEDDAGTAGDPDPEEGVGVGWPLPSGLYNERNTVLSTKMQWQDALRAEVPGLTEPRMAIEARTQMLEAQRSKLEALISARKAAEAQGKAPLLCSPP